MAEIMTQRSLPLSTIPDLDATGHMPPKVDPEIAEAVGTKPGDDLSPNAALIAGMVQSAALLRDRMQALDADPAQIASKGELRDNMRVAAHDLASRIRGLASGDVPIPPELRRPLLKVLGEEKAPDAQLQTSRVALPSQIRSLGSPPPATDEKDAISDADLWDQISKLIGQLKDGFLDIFSGAADHYLAFNDALSEIMSQLSGWISKNGDGSKTYLNAKELRAALDKLKQDFSLPKPGAVLFPPQDPKAQSIEGATEEQARKWAKDLGLDARTVKETPPDSGKWVVTIDIEPIDRMIGGLPNADKDSDNATMSPFELDIWRSGFTSQENQVKTTMQALVQRYSTANSTYDNLVKVLSATIAATIEAAKGYLR